jgi:hypothetical protein
LIGGAADPDRRVVYRGVAMTIMSIVLEPGGPDLIEAERPRAFYPLAAGVRTQIAVCWQVAEDLALLRPAWLRDPRRQQLLDTLSGLLDELARLDDAALADSADRPTLDARYRAVQQQAQAAARLSAAVVASLDEAPARRRADRRAAPRLRVGGGRRGRCGRRP